MKRISIRQIAFTHSRVQFQYLSNGAVVNTVRQEGEVVVGDTRREGRGRGQQLVEDASEVEPGVLVESLFARVS